GSHASRVTGEGGMSLEGNSSKTHSSSAQPGDGEPGQTSKNVPGKGSSGRSSDGLVVVTVVAEDGTEVAHDVDDEEHHTLSTPHGEVAAAGVALNRVKLGGL